jgi:RNA-directed DNA polymerase
MQMDSHVLMLLGISTEEELSVLSRIIASPSSFYREFKILKKSGGTRTISSPYPSLAIIQSNILNNLFFSFEPNSSAYAYVKGKSAIDHARIHVNGRELLKLDIKDFFPSISRQMVFEALQRNGAKADVCFYISLICILNNGLPQGACTSPALSNLVFSPIDVRLTGLANFFGLKYSRYADDLAFSGGVIPRDLASLVGEILLEYGFHLNHKKTQLKLAGRKKIVTGVSISSGRVRAPKSFKRKLRAQIYELEKNIGSLARLPDFDPLIYERLIGRINYLLQIEPENKYAKLKKVYLSKCHQDFLGLVDEQIISAFV